MFFLSPDSASFHHWRSLLTTNDSDDAVEKTEQHSEIQSFVQRILNSCHRKAPLKSSDELALKNPSQWTNLKQLKGNYLEKKAMHMGTHWIMLKDW